MIAICRFPAHNIGRTTKLCLHGGIALKQIQQIAILLLTAALLAFLPVCAAADLSVVTLVGDDVRVELLSDTVIRVEAKDASGFEDRATLVAAGRGDFPGVAAVTRTEGDNLIAETDRYIVTLDRRKALEADAVTIADKNGNVLWRYSYSVDKAALTPPVVTSQNLVYYNYPNGSSAADGSTAATAKQGWGATAKVLGAKGGTIVFSGRGYMGGSYTFPKQSSPLYITAVAPDGTDYRYAAGTTALDDMTGTLSIREGLTLTLQSDVTFDKVILLSSGATPATIKATGGATVAFGEGVTFAATDAAYPAPVLNIAADSTALWYGGAFSAVTGGGTLVVNRAVLAGLDADLFADFTGKVVDADGAPLCTGYRAHSFRGKTCTVCGYVTSEGTYVPTRGFYSALPDPGDTPAVYALADYPRIIPAAKGAAYVGSTDAASGFVRRDATDIYLVLTSGDAVSLRTDVVTLTGRAPVSNIKTFGSWYSRYQDWTDTDYRNVIANYRANGFPLDVLVIDTKWRAAEDGTGYDIAANNFPDMPGFLADAHKSGVLTIFNDHTHQSSNSALSPTELKWHTENLQKILGMGLDGWWYDRNWKYALKSPYSEITPSTLGKVIYSDILTDYAGDKRIFLMVNADWDRNGTIESDPSVIGHRYGIQWTGDITSEALQLREELTNMVDMTAVGASPYISSDLGGFKRARQQTNEMYTRWMQYGALSPVFRIHSTMTSGAEFNKLPYNSQYTAATQTIVRNYMNLRYNLLPLFYTLGHEAYETGLPLTRRLDFYYDADEAKGNTAYLLGRDLLVAPLWSAYGEGDEVVPAAWLDGVTAQYYNNTSLSGDAVYTASYADINFEFGSGSPNTAVNADNFSAVYTGKITPAEDCYLGIVADDGARLYLDGELIADGWKADWMVSYVNTERVLRAGKTYSFRVEYYDKSGGAVCRLVYEHVTDKGATARDVYLPAGGWIDVFTGKTYAEAGTYRVTNGIETTPLFARVGAILPAVKAVSPITAADFEALSLNVFPGGDGSYTLYEDDGETLGYQTGKQRTTAMTQTATASGGSLTIGAAAGSFTTAYTARTVTVRLHSAAAISHAMLDGKPAAVKRIPRDSAAFPLAETGAAPDSDVYEITFEASLASAHTLTWATVRGDLDGDGEVTVRDALLLLRALLCGTADAASDMDGDGAVILQDVFTLLSSIG